MRIAFADLDGTLLTTQKTVSTATFSALDELARADVELVPCSGRPFVGLPPEVLAHPAVRHAVCASGALVYEVAPDGSMGAVLHAEPIAHASVLALYDALHARDLLFDVFTPTHVYMERERYDHMADYIPDRHFLPQLQAMRTPTDVSLPELIERLGTDEPVVRATVYWRRRPDRDLAVSLVDADPALTWVNSMPINLEISSARATKGAALVWLCGHLGIPVAESVAFGDSGNDVTMLEAAGDGVAMGNALPVANAAADHVTASNDEDGVAAYLRSLL